MRKDIFSTISRSFTFSPGSIEPEGIYLASADIQWQGVSRPSDRKTRVLKSTSAEAAEDEEDSGIAEGNIRDGDAEDVHRAPGGDVHRWSGC